MEARLKAEMAGSRLGALRRKGASPLDLLAAERELADAQFELTVENAVRRHMPSSEVMERLFDRLRATAAA